MIVKTVKVRFEQDGMHKWLDASPLRDYLATRHRHLFEVKVTIQVSQADRQVEFHDLLTWGKDTFEDLSVAVGPVLYFGNFGNWSCEKIASKMLERLQIELGSARQSCSVEVWEDGECGGCAEYMPDRDSVQAMTVKPTVGTELEQLQKEVLAMPEELLKECLRYVRNIQTQRPQILTDDDVPF